MHGVVFDEHRTGTVTLIGVGEAAPAHLPNPGAAFEPPCPFLPFLYQHPGFPPGNHIPCGSGRTSDRGVRAPPTWLTRRKLRHRLVVDTVTEHSK